TPAMRWSRAHAVAARRGPRRLAPGGAFRVRLPRSRQPAHRRDVRPHDGGVRARGAARRQRQVRAVLWSSEAAPIFFDLGTDSGQIHDVAGDRAYAATVLDYAQR